MVEMNFWEEQNEKTSNTSFTINVALAGCGNIQRSLRGDDYVDSSLAAEESSKAAAQSAKELNDALQMKTQTSRNFLRKLLKRSRSDSPHKSGWYPY